MKEGLKPYLETYREVPLKHIQRELNKFTNNNQDYWALDMYGHMLEQ